MKKSVHYILSYLGSILMFTGLSGTILKHSFKFMGIFDNSFIQIMMLIIPITIGLYCTYKFYIPNKYQ